MKRGTRGGAGLLLACAGFFSAIAAGTSTVATAQDVARFRRGDFNADGVLDNSDAIAILGHLYSSAAPPLCRDAGDTNDDASLDLSDAIYLLQHLFNGGRPPRAPWPACGTDPTADGLDCRSYEGSAKSPCSALTRDRNGERILYLTNLERDKLGLAPLKHNDLLERAMLGHLTDMARNAYFSHTSSDGRILTDRIDAVGYRWQTIGENIAAGYTTPEVVLAGWMASSTHRANILSPRFRELGAAHFFDAATHYGHYWGQDFGTQTNFFPVVINLEAPTTGSTNVELHVYGEGWAAEMQIANDAAFVGATWLPYRATWDWVLQPGPGVKTVHVKLRKGTEIRAVQDQIVLAE